MRKIKQHSDDGEPTYEKEQDMHRERERERDRHKEKRYISKGNL